MRTCFALIALVALVLHNPFEALGQGTSVECPVTNLRFNCGESQVAICRVSDAGSEERCLTPPEGISGLPLDLWLLSYVLDDTLTVTTMSVNRYLRILEQGEWESEEYRVVFALPDDWQGTRARDGEIPPE